jgi:hypothetical protein
MSPVQIIERLFSGDDQWQPEIKYDSDLPPIVREWHIYLSDSGHCLLTLVEGMFEYTAPGKAIETSNRNSDREGAERLSNLRRLFSY